MNLVEIRGKSSWGRFIRAVVKDNSPEEVVEAGIHSNTETDDGAHYIAEVENDSVNMLVSSYYEWCIDNEIEIDDLEYTPD